MYVAFHTKQRCLIAYKMAALENKALLVLDPYILLGGEIL